jgi:hypothetical protein
MFSRFVSLVVVFLCAELALAAPRCTNVSAASEGAVMLNGNPYLVGASAGALCIDRWSSETARYEAGLLTPVSSSKVVIAGVTPLSRDEAEVLVASGNLWEIWQISASGSGIRANLLWQGPIQGPRVSFAATEAMQIVFGPDDAVVISDHRHICGKWSLRDIRPVVHSADIQAPFVVVSAGEQLAVAQLRQTSCTEPQWESRRFFGSLGPAAWSANSVIVDRRGQILCLTPRLEVRHAFASLNEMHRMTRVGESLVYVGDSEVIIVRGEQATRTGGAFAGLYPFRSSRPAPVYLTDGEHVWPLGRATSMRPLNVVTFATPLGVVVAPRRRILNVVAVIGCAAIGLIIGWWARRRRSRRSAEEV